MEWKKGLGGTTDKMFVQRIRSSFLKGSISPAYLRLWQASRSSSSFTRFIRRKPYYYNKYNQAFRMSQQQQTGDISEVTSGTTIGDTTVSSPRIFKPIVWIDCEMTGLDHQRDHIIEICCVITDGHLNIVDKQSEGNCYESVIHYGREVMDNMNEWCIEHHGASGLTYKVLQSEKTREQVEEELLAYIKQFIPDKNVGVLAGNSIHMDRLFMLREFPKVIDHLFYRLIDVSSISEVCRRFNPDLANVFPRKAVAHTARSDILESIAQLQWYVDHYLKRKEETEEFVEMRLKEIEEGKREQLLGSSGEESAAAEGTNATHERNPKSTGKPEESKAATNSNKRVRAESANSEGEETGREAKRPSKA